MSMNRKIWRYSYVTMWYSTLPNTDTPLPLCEIRAFIYLNYKPKGNIQNLRIKNMLRDEVVNLINKIGLSKTIGSAIDRGSLVPEDVRHTRLDEIDFVPQKSGDVKVLINGFEREPIEIISSNVIVENRLVSHKFFKMTPRQIIPNKIFRYVAFFNKDGRIKADYDEFDILNGVFDK